MRLTDNLHLYAFIPLPQSFLPPTTSVGSSSSPPVLFLPQLNFDSVLTPAETIPSGIPMPDAATLPKLILPSSLDSATTTSPCGGTLLCRRDGTPSLSGVCRGLIEDSDITGLGEHRSLHQICFFLNRYHRHPDNFLPHEHSYGLARNLSRVHVL